MVQAAFAKATADGFLSGLGKKQPASRSVNHALIAPSVAKAMDGSLHLRFALAKAGARGGDRTHKTLEVGGF
jgi:hypothetical protein